MTLTHFILESLSGLAAVFSIGLITKPEPKVEENKKITTNDLALIYLKRKYPLHTIVNYGEMNRELFLDFYMSNIQCAKKFIHYYPSDTNNMLSSDDEDKNEPHFWYEELLIERNDNRTCGVRKVGDQHIVSFTTTILKTEDLKIKDALTFYNGEWLMLADVREKRIDEILND